MALACGWELWKSAALTACFDQFASDVACDLQGLGNSPPLRDKTGKFIRCCQEQAFGQLVHMYADGESIAVIVAFVLGNGLLDRFPQITRIDSPGPSRFAVRFHTRIAQPDHRNKHHQHLAIAKVVLKEMRQYEESA